MLIRLYAFQIAQLIVLGLELACGLAFAVGCVLVAVALFNG